MRGYLYFYLSLICNFFSVRSCYFLVSLFCFTTAAPVLHCYLSLLFIRPTATGNDNDDDDDDDDDDESIITIAVAYTSRNAHIINCFHCRWFHPKATRHIAESLLMQNGNEGSFLLRPGRTSDSYAISIR